MLYEIWTDSEDHNSNTLNVHNSNSHNTMHRLRTRQQQQQQSSDADVRRGAEMIREQMRQKLEQARHRASDNKTQKSEEDPPSLNDTLASTSSASEDSRFRVEQQQQNTTSPSRIAQAKDIMLRNLKKTPSQRHREKLPMDDHDEEESVYTVDGKPSPKPSPARSLLCGVAPCIGSPSRKAPPPPPPMDEDDSLLMDSPDAAKSPLPRSPPRDGDDDYSLLYDSPWSLEQKTIEENSLVEQGPPPPDTSDNDTPITFMGKNRSLRTKIITYLVEPIENQCHGAFNDDFDLDEDGYTASRMSSIRATSTVNTHRTSEYPSIASSEEKKLEHSFEYQVSKQAQHEYDEHPTSGRGTRSQQVPTMVSLHDGSDDSAMLHYVPSPLSRQYTKMMSDPAYQHAMRAGFVWQSLVGQHIRFPRHWWNGARSPPMGADPQDASPWQYLGRYKVRNNKFLNRLVSSRAKPGHLLLHIIVQDLISSRPVLQDVVVGCFHPNARGVRQTPSANPAEERSRDIWLAVRKLAGDDSVSVVDEQLAIGQPWDGSTTKGPLGPRQRITNDNLRAVFGESPPLETIFVPESELYSRLAGKKLWGNGRSPALALLQEFVFA